MADFIITQKLVTGLGAHPNNMEDLAGLLMGITDTSLLDDLTLKKKQSALNSTFNTAIDRLNRGKRWNSDTQAEEDLITKINLLTKSLTLLIPSLADLNILSNAAYIYDAQEGLPSEKLAGDVYIYLNNERDDYAFSVYDSGGWVNIGWGDTGTVGTAFWIDNKLYYVKYDGQTYAWDYILCSKEQYNYVADLAAITELYKIIGLRITDLGSSLYNLPQGGIPKTDLSLNVLASLDKADTAIQSLADYYTKTQVDALEIPATRVKDATRNKYQEAINTELYAKKDMQIVEVEKESNSTTLTNTTLNCTLNKLYHIYPLVNTLNINLPSISGSTDVSGILLNFTTGASPNISLHTTYTIESSESITKSTESFTFTAGPDTVTTTSYFLITDLTKLYNTTLNFSDSSFSASSILLKNDNTTISDPITITDGYEFDSSYLDAKIANGYTKLIITLELNDDVTLTLNHHTPDELVKYFGETIFRSNTTYEVSIIHNGDGWYVDTNYDDSTPIKNVTASTDLPIVDSEPTLYVELNCYHRLDYDISALHIVLPAVTDSSYVEGAVLYMSIDSNYTHNSLDPDIYITSADGKTISYFENFTFTGGVDYELNFTYNGSKWIISYGVVS